MQSETNTLEQARAYMQSSSRPLERARFAVMEGSGDVEQVYAELAHFQNEDGGFGHGLEPDRQSPESSVIATTVALQILGEVGASPEHPLVKDAMKYLVATYDDDKVRWPMIDPASTEAPHAPWWTYSDEFEKNFGQFLSNPRAEILGYLYQYPDQIPQLLRQRVTDSVVEHLQTAPEEMEMHDLLCYIRLVETPALPEKVYAAILPKIRTIVDQTVARDPAAWDNYGLTPLSVVSSPDSPFATGLAEAIQANLDWLHTHQEADGSWQPAWDWGGMYSEAWPAAKRDWSGVITLDTIRKLKAFGRI